MNSLKSTEAEAMNDKNEYVLIEVPHQMRPKLYSGTLADLVKIANASPRLEIVHLIEAPTYEDQNDEIQKEGRFTEPDWYVRTMSDGEPFYAGSIGAALREAFGHDANSVVLVDKEEGRKMIDSEQTKCRHQGVEIRHLLIDELV